MVLLVRRLGAIVWLAFAFAAIGPASAQSVIEKLISPGALSSAHARLEARCEACHTNFKKTAQAQLCKACHKDVASDISAKRGFHGKFPAASADCNTCHVEHAGRGKDIVGFNKASFNHAFTDYPLRGKHAGTACASCHAANRKFRDAPRQCAACHKKDDAHRGSLGADCASCHTESGWTEAKFDHGTTRFPLTGAHAGVKCQSCHADGNFAATPVECISCHRKDDAHNGALGPQCANCHTAADWKSTRFDHSRTGFPLTGRHADVACKTCHVSPAGAVRLATTCIGCHRKDDVHKGANGPECASCHTAVSWKATTFDHSRTSFPLKGRHAQAACAACHTSPPGQKKLAADCVSCHAKDDRHEGQLGARCAQCHTEDGWKTSVRFDHEFAPFPLIGKHAAVPCASCHATARFKDASTSCASCHTKDDKHQGAFGSDCSTCHNPSDWENWIFNHDTQTSFVLTGAHVRITCSACHGAGRKKLSSICGDCHAADDAHQGAFGPACGRCHSTDSFRNLRNRF